MTTTDQGHGPATGRRPRLARGTIVGWVLVILAATLASILLVANGVLRADVAAEANGDVTQEIEEFRTFAAEGQDPETGQPFTSTERMLQVFLDRQRAGTGELIMGYVGRDGQVLEVRGPEVPAPGEYDLAADQAFLDEVADASSGTRDTPAGEIRWGRAVVEADGPDGVLVVAVFTADAQAGVTSTLQLLTLLSLGGMVLAGVVSWVAAGRILRPVHLVHLAAAEITEKDLTRRIDVSSDDDVSGLAVTFNRMLDRLEEAFAAEQRFVDDAGHELRTPITIIRGHLELIDDDPRSREATLRIVTEELDRMSRIVTDLLSLAKADRPDFLRVRDGVDLAELTLAVDAKMSALAPRRWLIAHVAEGSARLDTERVTQAVLQLAQNAVQHTGEGDAITLSSLLEHDPALGPVARIAVADTGPGVPVADRERIFERFSHGDPPDGRRHAGAGLGLAIVRAIAEAHGGRVEVGGAPGEGATFALVLPLGERTSDGTGGTDRADDVPDARSDGVASLLEEERV